MKYLFALLFVLVTINISADIFVPYNDPEFKTITRTLKSIPGEFRHSRYDTYIQSLTDKEAYIRYGWMEQGLLGLTNTQDNHVYLIK